MPKKEKADIRSLLRSVGFSIGSESEEFIRVNAIWRGSSDHNIAVNKYTGTAADFSHGSSYTFEGLLKKAKGEALTKDEQKSLLEAKKLFREEEKFVPPEKIYPASLLDKLFPSYGYWLGRGISQEILEFTRGGLCHESPFYRYYVFPVFNSRGQIHGLSGRDTTGRQKIKWKHEGKSGTFIYGVYMPLEDGSLPVKESILEEKEVNIVESIGDCLSAWECGLWNVVPSFGLNISPKLLSFLLAVGAKINIFYNNDVKKNGNFAAVKNFCKVYNLGEVGIKLTDEGVDLNDMLQEGKEKVLDWYNRPCLNNTELKNLFWTKKKWISNGKVVGLTNAEQKVYEAL